MYLYTYLSFHTGIYVYECNIEITVSLCNSGAFICCLFNDAARSVEW
jgi:hypothetical protein